MTLMLMVLPPPPSAGMAVRQHCPAGLYLFLLFPETVPLCSQAGREIPAVLCLGPLNARDTGGHHHSKLLTGQVGRAPNIVMVFDCSMETMVRRVLRRGQVEHRADDSEPAIRKRLETHYTLCEPVLTFYQQKKLLRNRLNSRYFLRLAQHEGSRFWKEKDVRHTE
ncbi:adenylate kinase isoenzyme 1-like isoform X5 [Onychomys torridus]|uniref:adenylate kinase isoenzyme 1-like isoform X5 n=1 Tax=Onychomys torridus TaxID=38674 RepID=UPI00167FB005|nr:adenylate kinase isoenzyme 1-like isoform X5 [Onychomys torridus]